LLVKAETRGKMKKYVVLLLVLILVSTIQAVILTTADGNGADTYVTTDDVSKINNNFGLLNRIQLRTYDDGAGVHRFQAPYIRFDISSVTGSFDGAQLQVQNYDKGTNSVRTWSVYGLNDGEDDNWGEYSISYNNAPGMLPVSISGTYAIDTTKLTLLGTMDYPNNAGFVTSNTTDLNLTSFLEADTNGLVTFVIIDEAVSGKEWYLSSKERDAGYSSYLGPRLRFPPSYVYSDYDWYSYNGHQYALTIEHNNWLGCEAEAVALGGHLVTINDPAEHQWLLNVSPLCSSYAIGYPGEEWQNGSWIGMYYDGIGDIHSLDSWIWLTGEVGSDFLLAPDLYDDGLHMCITGTYHPYPGLLVNGPHSDLIPSYYLQGIIELVPPSLLTPTGGETLLAGTKSTIQWETNLNINNVLIEYSLNNGASWTEVSPPNIGNTGQYDWIVPFVESDLSLIRISDMDNPTVTDTSDSAFTIYRCRSELVTDFDMNCKVNLYDYVYLAEEWLECGNEFESCNIDLPAYEGTDLLAEYELGNWTDLTSKGEWLKSGHAFRIMPSPGDGPDFGWSYPLPTGLDSFRVIKRFKMNAIGAIQVVFTDTPDSVEGYGVFLSYNWYAGLSVGDLSSRSDMITMPLNELSEENWHELVIDVMPGEIIATLDKGDPIEWYGSFTPTSITLSGDEFIDWYIQDLVLTELILQN